MEAVSGEEKGERKGLIRWVNLKVLASLAGLGLAGLLVFGLWVDIMPKAITEVEIGDGGGSTGERALGGERFQFVLAAVSDWEVVGAVVGMAVVPVVVLKGLR